MKILTLLFTVLAGINSQAAETPVSTHELSCRIGFPGSDPRNNLFVKELDPIQENIFLFPETYDIDGPKAWIVIGPVSDQGIVKWSIKVKGENKLTLHSSGATLLAGSFFEARLEEGENKLALGVLCAIKTGSK